MWEFAFGERTSPPVRRSCRPASSIRRAGAARDACSVTQDGTRRRRQFRAIPAPSPRRARSRQPAAVSVATTSSCLGFVERARAERGARRRDGRPGRVSDPRDARAGCTSTTAAKRVFATSMPSSARDGRRGRARARPAVTTAIARETLFSRSASRAGSRARPRAAAGSHRGARVATPSPPQKTRRGAASAARRAARSSATSVDARRVTARRCRPNRRHSRRRRGRASFSPSPAPQPPSSRPKAAKAAKAMAAARARAKWSKGKNKEPARGSLARNPRMTSSCPRCPSTRLRPRRHPHAAPAHHVLARAQGDRLLIAQKMPALCVTTYTTMVATIYTKTAVEEPKMAICSMGARPLGRGGGVLEWEAEGGRRRRL